MRDLLNQLLGGGAPPAPATAAPPPPGPWRVDPPFDAPAPGAEPMAALPADLSPLGMFMAADIVVQTVMVGLVVASVVTWTVWLAKSLELRAARKRARVAVAALDAAPSLAEAAAGLGDRRGVVRGFVDAALAELRLSADSAGDGIKERIGSRLARAEAAAGRRMIRGTGVLATIGATAPFVGLFGTVWGIMNGFVGIAEAQTTSLAVVAPSIAEALLATAMGLVAAIPAVVIYNHFARAIAGYRATLADACAAVERLVSRDLDRRQTPAYARAAE